ncbi:hypothetical protein HG535_0G03760 [Zygotorulaspora mrakii]|uniref:C3H1-type domain-containing protein n=1 Tax=Zygotorulaspora mrakii TaxID=42260 RepID=A0A7H9B7L0_ZYGMR|nr:uncharacterized protein HG535_0G03760 [Zygotorulaspora mrakii]QLG74493.1 hypothetical protein HG535_0G03760 [Zygotorulaspora mrakii]
MDGFSYSFGRAPSPGGDGANVAYLARTPSGGNSFTTSASTCTYTSSVFSTEEDSYDSRIKEIEQYYIKTLLNEDENKDDYRNHDSFLSDHSKVPVSYYQHLNDFKPRETAQQQQQWQWQQQLQQQQQWQQLQQQQQQQQAQLQAELQKQNQLQTTYSNATGGTESAISKPKNKKNILEVEINHNLRPVEDPLPLTTENLQRLTISGCNQQRSVSRADSQSLSQGYPGIHKTTQPAQQPQLNKELYKTELCESFTTKGSCRYGNKCQFAHGLHELKFKPKSNNYRTKPCVNWTKNGYCPYGKRCCFKHGNDEDIQLQAGHSDKFASRKNLHANVKALQKITW